MFFVCLGSNHAQLRDEEPWQTSDLVERIPGHVNPVPVLPLSQRNGKCYQLWNNSLVKSLALMFW